MERRDAERYDASATIKFRSGANSGTVELRDISVGGCRLADLHEDVLQGDDVTLTLLEGIVMGGFVHWRTEELAGVSFDQPIDDTTLNYFRFAAGIVAADDINVDRFGRPLPPINGRAGSRRN